MVRALGRATIAAAVSVVVMCHGCDVKLTGGIRIQANNPKTAAEWCEHHGVEVKDGVAILYKGVYADFRSEYKCDYSPGLTPVAADWDGGKKECGGGLHFSPSPIQTRRFCSCSKHYVACPVALADMRAPQESDQYPDKIKARGCCAPTWECDADGNTIEQPIAVEGGAA